MKKIIFIVMIGLFLMVLCAFMFSSGKNLSYSRLIDDNTKMSLITIPSLKYAEMTNAEPEDLEQYQSYFYFLFRIENVNGGANPLMRNLESEEEFGRRVNYLSNEISRDIILIQEEDTLSCALAHWERTYNMRKDLTISLAFKKLNNKAPDKFIWNDNLFTGLPVKLKLD